MISKEDRMYYIEPLQPAIARAVHNDGTPLPLQVLALRYRRDNHKTERIGTVVPVTHQRVENNELWWVDSDGDYVYGAQLCDYYRGRGSIMAIVNDDLFYVGRNGGEHHLGSTTHGSVLNTARRSDGKQIMGTGGSVITYVSPLVIKAASWAHELMPVPGDTPEIIKAKVARAKQNYIQRHKKGEIYKEGMRRDWLHHLETLRAEHDMPTPVFNVGIEGTFLALGGDSVAMDTLTEVQRERLAPLSRNSIVRTPGRVTEDTAQTFVGRPFITLTTLTANDAETVNRLTQSDVRYAVFDALRTHSGHIIETLRFPILTSF